MKIKNETQLIQQSNEKFNFKMTFFCKKGINKY